MHLSPEDEAEGEGSKISEEEMANSSIKDCEYVFPSARTISNHKQLLASETESEAAMALLDKDSTIKAIVHFDTTSRNNIDYHFAFSNGEEFRLRPIFFAHEDREQITSLFSETFKRLAAAVSIQKGVIFELSVLCREIDALITDYVTKNLGVEDMIYLWPLDHTTTHFIYCAKATQLRLVINQI